MSSRRLFGVALVSLLGFSVGTAHAAVIYSGVDIGGGVSGPRTNSDAAHATWAAAAGPSDALEDFEAIALGSSSPLSLSGGITLSTLGTIASGNLNIVASDGDPQIGYNTTAGGTNFFRLAPEFGGVATMTLTFDDPVLAFGVYITGVQSGFGGTVVYIGADSFNLPDTQGAPGLAGVQFFGFTSAVPIGSISFVTTANPGVGRDIMGFDDLELVRATAPAPPVGVLLLVGLAAAAARGRRFVR